MGELQGRKKDQGEKKDGKRERRGVIISVSYIHIHVPQRKREKISSSVFEKQKSKKKKNKVPLPELKTVKWRKKSVCQGSEKNKKTKKQR